MTWKFAHYYALGFIEYYFIVTIRNSSSHLILEETDETNDWNGRTSFYVCVESGLGLWLLSATLVYIVIKKYANVTKHRKYIQKFLNANI